MDWNTVEGNWKQLKGKLQETWGDLTDDELDVIAGKRDQLVGKIQAKYGIAKEEAERQVDAFTHKFADGYDHDNDTGNNKGNSYRRDDSEGY